MGTLSTRPWDARCGAERGTAELQNVQRGVVGALWLLGLAVAKGKKKKRGLFLIVVLKNNVFQVLVL